ncbi:serine/threonine-protein kinase, partial [Myxococcota bacterium]
MNELFGHYELLEQVGSGGMADVFLARDKEHPQRKVAVKRLKQSISRVSQFVSLFLHEARIATLVEHPNIVKVYEAGVCKGVLYIAMEWLIGWDLSEIMDRLRERKEFLPVPIAVQVVADACAGLHAAHSAETPEGEPLRLIHRDATPQNLFITTEGALKILDFGVAKSAIKSHKTHAGMVMGKVAYLSPEQLTGHPDLDHRSDVFSLGVVLHELLSGGRLFKRPQIEQIRAALLFEPIPPPARDNEPLDASLATATMRALQRDPEMRFPTAKAFADALSAAVDPCWPVISQDQRAKAIAGLFKGLPSLTRHATVSGAQVRVGMTVVDLPMDPLDAASADSSKQTPVGWDNEETSPLENGEALVSRTGTTPVGDLVFDQKTEESPIGRETAANPKAFAAMFDMDTVQSPMPDIRIGLGTMEWRVPERPTGLTRTFDAVRQHVRNPRLIVGLVTFVLLGVLVWRLGSNPGAPQAALPPHVEATSRMLVDTGP